jgi:hypothetical protein
LTPEGKEVAQHLLDFGSSQVKGAQVSVTPNWIYAMSPESSCTANIQGKLGK